MAGDREESWVSAIKETLSHIVYQWTPPQDLKQQIFHLRDRKEKELSAETTRRKNIKEGYGGLLDVEFLTQYLQICHGPNILALRASHTLEVLEQLQNNEILDQTTTHTLKKAYTFYRLLESYLRLLCDTDTNMLDFDNLQTDKMVVFLHHQGYAVTDVWAAYQQTSQNVREIYLQVMADSSPSSRP